MKKGRLIARKITDQHGLKVLAGPFTGLKYTSLAAAGSGLTPKLIGTYEEEIHPFIEELIETEYKRVINIGCGEGYYAVGMALRMPEAHIYAFDIDEKARQLCRNLAQANGVSDRITINAKCTNQKLKELTRVPAIIICDCEGCELQILNPDEIKTLQNDCDILVELHTIEGKKEIAKIIIARFRESHRIKLKKFNYRDPSDYPQIDFLSDSEQTFAVDENRSRGMQWALLTSRN